MSTNQLLMPRNATQIFIPGPEGVLDTLVLTPKDEPKGVAIVFHPDPKGGGTNTNKIVQTLAKALNNKGYLVYCPNLRGVGMSSGTHDFGQGEIADGQAVLNYINAHQSGLPLVLAGFSFGSAIASNVAMHNPPHKLVLIGPAVTRYSVPIKDKLNTLVIHGEEDEVIPLSAVMEWGRNQDLPISVFPATGHFFHGKLVQLQAYLTSILMV